MEHIIHLTIKYDWFVYKYNIKKTFTIIIEPLKLYDNTEHILSSASVFYTWLNKLNRRNETPNII